MRVHITSIYNQMGTHVIAQQNVMKVASTLGFVEMLFLLCANFGMSGIELHRLLKTGVLLQD